MVTYWCAARGQSLQDYQGHLGRGRQVDGLEILLALVALDTPIIVVMKDTVWMIAKSGIDFSLLTIVLTQDGGIPCHYLDPDARNAMDIDTSTSGAMVSSSSFEQLPEYEQVPFSLLKRPQGGWLLAKVVEYQDDHNSTSTETDLDEHLNECILSTESRQRWKPTGKALPQQCPSCGVEVASKVNLVHHLCTIHLTTHLFSCEHCDTCFNNAADLASHVSNSHSKKKIVCHHCDYSTVNKSRMCTHVRKHTTGLKCSRCTKGFPMKHALLKHQLLHGKYEEFQCEQCDQVYAMENSLQVHI